VLNHARRLSLPVVFVVAGVLLILQGCSTYSGSIRRAQKAIADGRSKAALGVVNRELGVRGPEQVPPDLEDARVLYLLERGTILQAMGEYELAARDMMVADDRLEFLDLSSADSVEIGKYLYSGSSTTYRAPAYERLLLNTLNMANFLAMGDLEGAKVEARRFTLIESFFVDHENQIILPRVRALGNYLGGVAFEAAGDLDEATRYYSHAYYYGFESNGLRERLIDLYRLSRYQPGELRRLDKDALQGITEEADRKGALAFENYRRRHLQGDTILVVQSGMAPFKEAKRFPVGQAVQISMSSRYRRHRLSQAERARFLELAAASSLAAVKFPALTHKNLPRTRSVRLSLEGRSIAQSMFPAVDVAEQVEHAWKQMRGAVMAAAITRLITRLVASKGTKELTAQAADSKAAGFLAGLLVYGSMELADQPDTRSWTMLPAHIRIARMQLKEGSYPLELRIGPKTRQKTIKIGGNRLNFFNFSEQR
jgi:hypothetical protein